VSRLLLINRLALRNLWRGGRRSLLLGLALSAASFLLILVSGLSGGLEATLMRASETLMTGHVNVGGYYKVTHSLAAPLIHDVARTRTQIEALLPEAEILERLRGFGRVVGRRSAFHAALLGVSIEEERGLLKILQPLSGELEALKRPDTCFLFARQAQRLGLALGEQLSLVAQTTGGRSNTRTLEVVAIVRDIGFLSAWNLFLNRESLRGLYQLKKDTAGALQIYLPDPGQARATMERLYQGLQAAGYDLLEHDPQPYFMKIERYSNEEWTGARLDLSTWQDETQYLQWLLAGLASLRWILLFSLISLISLGIMNTLWIAVGERSREIGTLRAIGMGRVEILLLFLGEAAALGGLSALLGGGLGALSVWLLNALSLPLSSGSFQAVLMSDELRLQLSPELLFSSLLMITLISTLAALPPAWRAARVQPLIALQALNR